MAEWIYKEVDVVLPASLVLHLFRRADRFRRQEGGRFERQGPSITIWGAVSTTLGLQLEPRGAATFAWVDPSDEHGTIWRLARLAWDPERCGEAAMWEALEGLAERSLVREAGDPDQSKQARRRLLHHVRALAAMRFRPSTRRFFAQELQDQLMHTGYRAFLQAGQVAAGRLALELTWGLIDDAQASQAWEKFLRSLETILEIHQGSDVGSWPMASPGGGTQPLVLDGEHGWIGPDVVVTQPMDVPKRPRGHRSPEAPRRP